MSFRNSTSDSIAMGFSRGAPTYDGFSFAHKKIASALVSDIQEMIFENKTATPKRILDVGAGTGILSEMLSSTFTDTKITLNDISHGMLDVASKKFGNKFDYIQENFEQNDDPFAYDAVVSSMAMHWFKNIHTFMRKASLGSNIFAFSIPVCGTFREWYHIFHSINLPDPQISYKSSEEMRSLCDTINSSHRRIREREYKLTFDSTLSVMKYLKAIGANFSKYKYDMHEIMSLVHKKNSSPIEISYNVFFGVFLK